MCDDGLASITKALFLLLSLSLVVSLYYLHCTLYFSFLGTKINQLNIIRRLFSTKIKAFAHTFLCVAKRVFVPLFNKKLSLRIVKGWSNSVPHYRTLYF